MLLGKLKKFFIFALLSILGSVLVACHHQDIRSIPTDVIRTKQEQHFDYYLLALSWAPFYCKTHPSDQAECGQSQHYHFILHGLWPQNNCKNPATCYPSYCSHEKLDDAIVKEMLAFMIKPSLIKHEWQKHGTCSGLTQQQYFNSAKNLFIKTKIPAIFYQTKGKSLIFTAKKITDLFAQSNPYLNYNSIRLITNQSHELSAIEICFDKSLASIACPFASKVTPEQQLTITLAKV